MPLRCSIFEGAQRFFRGCKYVWISMNFWLGKIYYPRDRDVAGGHTGYQVHIPQPGLENWFMCLRHEHLFVFDSSVVQQQIDWPVKKKCCRGCPSSLDSPASRHLWRTTKLESLLIWYLWIGKYQAWMMRACRTRTHTACTHPCRSAWAFYYAVCPGHLVHAHTHQYIQRTALHIPCATAKLRRCEQGSVKHLGGAS